MRAALITKLGDPPNVVDRPEVAGADSDGDVPIEVLASALNPIDIAVASGRFFAGHPPLPYVPGAEAVGRVIADRPGLDAGTLVYAAGAAFGTGRDGGLAERAVAPREALVPLPADADPATAAALGIAGLAGWIPLAWRAPIRDDDEVLVLGATGIVGRVAVQAAKLLGAARVVAAGRDQAALSTTLAVGADAIVLLDGVDANGLVDRIRDAFEGGGPTYVFDPLWGPAIEASVQAARPNARIVNLGQSAGADATIPSGAVRGKQLDILGYLNFAVPADVRADAHRALLDHAAAGRIRVPVEHIPLDQVVDCWRRQAQGPRSKFVVLPAAAR
ncbi:MAG: zinc-binding alcohol dehydrogenase family protein [Solirubrobacteraceae bacterium]